MNKYIEILKKLRSENISSEIYPGEGKIKKQMELYEQNRNDTQPQRVNCCGSIFKNPPNHNAWKLIKTSLDESFYEGPVRLSKKHSNFFINKKNASFEEMNSLINFVKKNVKDKTGININLEIKIIE